MTDLPSVHTATDVGSVVEMMRLVLQTDQPSVEVIERLVALQERNETRRAVATFFTATHDFHSAIGVIAKNRGGPGSTPQGTKAFHPYADLAQIAETIRGPLSDAGLSYSWDVRGEVCVCIVAHVDGHSIERGHPIHAPGGKLNAPQNYAAGVSYAKRYSLLNALGIVTADPDTDGNEVAGVAITEAQLVTLQEHVHTASEETGVPVADVLRRFLKVLAVDSLEDVDAGRYEFALAKIQERRK